MEPSALNMAWMPLMETFTNESRFVEACLTLSKIAKLRFNVQPLALKVER